MARRRSISTPIILGVFTVVLSIALLVAWILVLVRNLGVSEYVAETAWLLPLGSTSFAVIIAVLVMFSVFLVREIRMVNRQSRFIDSVTHELKTPLASLKLCLETLDRDDLASAQRFSVRQMMIDDVARLSKFIDDVLEANRLSGHHKGHSVEDVVLKDLVQHCADSITRYHKQRPDAIRNRVSGAYVLATDRTVLETVIKNLLDNAVKYSNDSPEGGVEVTVDARADARYLTIEVADRGVGIPRKQLKNVFERFYRVEDESVRMRKGTGLGLYVAAALVRVLGGKLTASSEGLDQGTTMTVRLPARSLRTVAEPSSSDEPAADAPPVESERVR